MLKQGSSKGSLKGVLWGSTWEYYVEDRTVKVFVLIALRFRVPFKGAIG